MFYSQISSANIYFDYNSSVGEIILQYFERGFIYEDILSLLSVSHGVNWRLVYIILTKL